MQSSGCFRNESLYKVNKAVLKMINHKKYPLNQEKLLRIKRNKEKINASKVKTCPDELSSTHIGISSTSLKKKDYLQPLQRSMGQLFQQQQARDLMLSRIGNRDLQQITERINSYVWSKRKQLVQRLDRQKDNHFRMEESKSSTQNKILLRKSSSNNLQHFFSKLRQKMKEDSLRDSQVLENPIYRYTEVEDRRQQNSQNQVNFLRGNEQLVTVMRRYPLINEQFKTAPEDPHKQFQRDMAQQIRNNLLSDKFSRMRISINHRKIVSIR